MVPDVRASSGLDPLPDESARSQFRVLCFRQSSARIGHAITSASVHFLSFTLSLLTTWLEIVLAWLILPLISYPGLFLSRSFPILFPIPFLCPLPLSFPSLFAYPSMFPCALGHRCFWSLIKSLYIDDNKSRWWHKYTPFNHSAICADSRVVKRRIFMPSKL